MITAIPNRAYTILIALFTLASALFLGTGLWLFHLRYGWTLSDLNLAFAGSPDRAAISPEQLLKVSVPHTISIALFTFILGHFLIFAEPIPLKYRQWTAFGLVLSGLVNANIGWLIAFAPLQLALLKLISFLVFQFFFLATAWMILKSFLSIDQTTSFDLSKKL